MKRNGEGKKIKRDGRKMGENNREVNRDKKKDRKTNT